MTAIPPLFLTEAQNALLHPLGVQILLGALWRAGGETRVVGGAVRDVLLGLEVQDIDCATTLPPEAVTRALQAAGLKVVPTGIRHGTVTAIVEGKGYEITTLRRDVRADGRHAEVAYTDDWRVDAERRDFTFNALFVTEAGEVVDFFGGLEDLAARRVRFIGEAQARIREDALRILRAFRFVAQLSGVEEASFATLEEESQKACATLAPLTAILSAERVWKELSSALRAPAPARAFRMMEEAGVLAILFGVEDVHVACLARMTELESVYALSPCPIRRLAALLSDGQRAALRLRLSNAERVALEGMQELAAALDRSRTDAEGEGVKHLFYEQGTQKTRDAFLLAAAQGRVAAPSDALWQHLKMGYSPCFPLRGRDLIDHGVPSGPELGRALRHARDWWQAHDFAPDRQACLKKALAFWRGD